jgi:signal transduction histidine kinase
MLGARVGTACAVLLLSGAETFVEGKGLLDFLFVSFVLSCLVGVLALARRERRQSRSDADRVRELRAQGESERARAAVREERRRLSRDVTAELSRALRLIRSDVGTARQNADVAALRSIHARTQQATAELRRQLGLLHEEPDVPTEPPAHEVLRTSHVDVLVSLAVMALAGVEAFLYQSEHVHPRPLAVVLTVLAAGTVVGRRRAPGLAALACGVVFLVAASLDQPVEGGFWSFATLGGLSWTLAARAVRTDLLCGLALFAAVLLSTAVRDRHNVGIFCVLLLVAAAGGAVTGHARRRSAEARGAADRRTAELERAAEVAVAAERTAFAREIHDTVSHAIGVIAVQAAAAEVSHGSRPAVVARALDEIGATADAALLELARVDDGAASTHDLGELVQRIRAAGTPVELVVSGTVPKSDRAVVYRVVQEGLTNVLRHSAGSSAQVEVATTQAGTTVTVRDDGAGHRSEGPAGFGLIGLTDRVTARGGTLSAGPGPSGFLLEVALPAVRSGVPA